MSRAMRAMSKALPQELRLRMDVISTAAVPSSFIRPKRMQPCRPIAISVCISASFFWMSWLAAKGRPNCLRSNTYWRALNQQSSAAPNVPHAMPKRAEFKQVNGPLRPCTSGNAFSSGQNTLSITTSPVMEARKPILPWMAGALKPAMPFSSTKPRMGPTAPASVTSRAQITNTSAMGLLEIHILLPTKR